MSSKPKAEDVVINLKLATLDDWLDFVRSATAAPAGAQLAGLIGFAKKTAGVEIGSYPLTDLPIILGKLQSALIGFTDEVQATVDAIATADAVERFLGGNNE